MANVKQAQQMIPLSTREISLVKKMSASWFFGVDVFKLDFGIQINSIETTNQVQLCES